MSHKSSPKNRLDKALVDRNLSEHLAKAQALILAGQVTVNGTVVTKAGAPVNDDSVITILKQNPYVSRGGLKIEPVFDSLGLSVQGKVCMDVGSSTGGFTDFMLQRGAKKVVAIDVGKGQLHYKLRKDPRIELHEGVNFRHFSMESLKEDIEFVTIDVSFISLENILPLAGKIVVAGGGILAMVKPQFEVERSDLDKGVVKDPIARQTAIDKIKEFSKGLGLVVSGSQDAGLPGPEGNLEHFLYLTKPK